MALQHTLTVYINPTTNPTTHEANTALTNVASDATYTADGVLVFDEVAKLLYVKGVAYGLSATQATNLSNAVSDIATLKGSVSTNGSVLKIASDTADSKITAALGTSFGTGEGKYATVSAAITAALNAASAASTAASTAQSTADAKISNVTGYKSGTTADDLIDVTVSNHVANVKSKSALTDAVAAATSAVQSTTINGVSLTKNGTQLSGRLGSTDINYSEATEAQGTEGQSGYVAPKAAVTLKSKIDTLETAINALSGGSSTNLTEVLSKITEIENELKAGDTTDGSSDLSTIIDSLRTLKVQTTEFTGINANGTTGNGVALQTSLANLKTYADSAASNAIDNIGTATKSGGANVDGNASHIKVTVSTDDGKVSSVSVNENDIASATTLSTVQTTANAALPKGTSNHVDAAALESALKSELKGTKASGDTTAETIRGAKDYADAVAESAAEAVISWNVIGATS